ncbi:solute carrier family 22 member 7-like [Dermacentor andersoni]|uniref:solute carrier family 22 member 7-like n=1 Tax=Dermacentor andersoni TaxID=34620 RepID=UPI002416943D|nr:solute carrier family 22 member 13-like [Dermacentor andersoni]
MDVLLPHRLAGADLRTSESFDCEEAFGHGPFQKRMLVLILLGAFSANCQTVVISLATGDVDHWCKPLAGFNISAADWKNIAIQIEADGRFSRCRIYERCKPPAEHGDFAEPPKIGGVLTGTDEWHSRCFQNTSDPRDVPCEERDYDVRLAEASAVSSWNMVCDQRFLPTILVALQNAGALVSLILAAAFVDYVGRRVMLLSSATAVVTCTVFTFAATNYVRYAVVRFLTGAIVAVHTIFTCLIPFEVMTHAHRPQQVLLLAALGLALCEVWSVIIKPMVIDWRLKQVMFLAPTALLLPALSTARESPRWLVAKGRLEAAEAVMMQAAETNSTPLPVTACLVAKLREQINNHASRDGGDMEVLVDYRSLRRRALAMFAVCFSISFVFYLDAFSTAQYNEFWIPCLTAVITLAVYVGMHFLMTGVALVRVLSVCFLFTGTIRSALSVAVGAGFVMITKILLVLSKDVSNVMFLHCFTYVLELFPSAVRAGVAWWAFGFGRVADMCATMTLVVKPAGHEDVVFAIAGLFLFVSLLVIRLLPRTKVVEYARIVAIRASNSTRMSMDHMKRTLIQRIVRKKSKTRSLESSKSSSRKSGKSGGSKSPGNLMFLVGFKPSECWNEPTATLI